MRPGNLHISPHEFVQHVRKVPHQNCFSLRERDKPWDFGISFKQILIFSCPHWRKKQQHRGPGRQASSIRSRTRVDPVAVRCGQGVFTHRNGHFTHIYPKYLVVLSQKVNILRTGDHYRHQLLGRPSILETAAIGGMKNKNEICPTEILWNPHVSCFSTPFSTSISNFQLKNFSPTHSSTFHGSPLWIWTCWETSLDHFRFHINVRSFDPSQNHAPVDGICGRPWRLTTSWGSQWPARAHSNLGKPPNLGK